jgi:CheY-like chemotaxis protein
MSQRILIIDDEANIRRVTRLTLEAAGYEVGEAANGIEGLELYGDGSGWHAVLLDQKMPDMDGLETLRHIKESNVGARVIMVTAFASIDLAVDAMKLGATDFVRKPMTPEIVRNALTAALAKPEASSMATMTTAPVAPTVGKSQELLRPLIHTITLNGFEILRPTDTGAIPREPDEHRFIIKSPVGKEREVIVRIDAEVVGYVERMTRRRIPANSSFWAVRAERLLSDYLWRECELPFSGTLTLDKIDRDELMWAEQWDGK